MNIIEGGLFVFCMFFIPFFSVVGWRKFIRPKLDARKEKRIGLLNAVALQEHLKHFCGCGCGKYCDVDQGDVFDGQWWRKECYQKLLEN